MVAFAMALAACGTAASGGEWTDGVGSNGGVPDAGAGSSDAGGDASTLGSDAGGIDVVDSPPAPSPLSTCAVDVAWQSDAQMQWMEPTHFGVSPNGGALWASHHDAWASALTRTRDGEIIVQGSSRPMADVDDAWSRRVWISGAQVYVGSTVTDDTTLLAEVERIWWREAAISASGATAAAFGCVDTQPRVVAWDVVSGRTLMDWTGEPDENRTCTRHERRPHMEFVDGEDGLLVAPPLDSRLFRFDLLTGEHETAEVVSAAPPSEDNAWRLEGGVVTMQLDATRSRVAIVGADGTSGIWATDTLERVHDLGEVGVFILNHFTYAPPLPASPVAWSRSGDVLAVVAPSETLEGGRPETLAVEIRRTDSGETVARIERPPFGRGEAWNAVAALAFSASADALFVLDMAGMSAFTCDGRPVEVAAGGELEVIVDAPSSAVVGEPVEFVGTHLGQVDVHGHRFFIDGEAAGTGSFERTLEWTFEEPGVYTVRVEIDDGLRTGAAEAEVAVSAP